MASGVAIELAGGSAQIDVPLLVSSLHAVETVSPRLLASSVAFALPENFIFHLPV